LCFRGKGKGEGEVKVKVNVYNLLSKSAVSESYLPIYLASGTGFIGLASIYIGTDIYYLSILELFSGDI
jgi:hypothetical protein